jgi:hypothetical protein
MSKKGEEEVNNVRRITNYERKYYSRNAEIIYGGTRVGRWGGGCVR